MDRIRKNKKKKKKEILSLLKEFVVIFHLIFLCLPSYHLFFRLRSRFQTLLSMDPILPPKCVSIPSVQENQPFVFDPFSLGRWEQGGQTSAVRDLDEIQLTAGVFILIRRW